MSCHWIGGGVHLGVSGDDSDDDIHGHFFPLRCWWLQRLSQQRWWCMAKWRIAADMMQHPWSEPPADHANRTSWSSLGSSVALLTSPHLTSLPINSNRQLHDQYRRLTWPEREREWEWEWEREGGRTMCPLSVPNPVTSLWQIRPDPVCISWKIDHSH